MKKNKKVFVVLYHAEWESYAASSDIIGVYEDLDDAKEAMKGEIENLLSTNGAWTCDEENTERKDNDTSISLYDNVGCIDYVCVSINEREVVGHGKNN